MDKRLKHIKKSNRLYRLKGDEISDPSGVLDEFFSTYHLKDLREELWEWLCAGMCGDDWYETGRGRSNLIFLYENLEKLAEAAYIIHRRLGRKKKRKLKKKIVSPGLNPMYQHEIIT